jgi:hypothetical protein
VQRNTHFDDPNKIKTRLTKETEGVRDNCLKVDLLRRRHADVVVGGQLFVLGGCYPLIWFLNYYLKTVVTTL